MVKIAWDLNDSVLLFNPRYSPSAQHQFQSVIQSASNWPNHVWLSTSGSFNAKWVGLSKEALLVSADAVNRHLESQKEDRWIQALPDFHVGGVGVWARAYLTGSKVYDFKETHGNAWNPELFYHYMERCQGTLTALVPTQLYDLILLKQPPPSSLRAVIVGGGPLAPFIYQQAVDLRWPLLPSYGLTECASQVATASLDSWKRRQPVLKLLSHLRAVVQEDCLCVSGASLLSAYAYLEEGHVRFIDPKADGWFKTEDRGIIQDGELQIFGRTDEIVKIAGERVDLARLREHWCALCHRLSVEVQATLVAVEDPRLGHVLCLAVVRGMENRLNPLIEEFQRIVLPFERIRRVYVVTDLPRSPLGKILNSQLLDCIIETSLLTDFVASFNH
jgi:o-succinylbenzoate---CoA ligase